MCRPFAAPKRLMLRRVCKHKSTDLDCWLIDSSEMDSFPPSVANRDAGEPPLFCVFITTLDGSRQTRGASVATASVCQKPGLVWSAVLSQAPTAASTHAAAGARAILGRRRDGGASCGCSPL